MTDTHTFRLSNDLSEVPSLRDLFVQSCVSAGVDQDEMQGQMLVFTELINNAIEHGCKRPSDCVEGWYRITKDEIVVEVTDPSEVLTNADFENSDASNFAENGRGAGLFLVRALTDEINVRPGPNGGTTVRVTKLRGRGAA